MLSQRFVSLLPTLTSFVLLQKRKRELAPGYIWMDEETGVFLSLMQGDKTTIGYFNWMKLKNKKNKKKDAEDEGHCRHWGNRRLMKGLRSARQQSPFFTMVIRDEWLVSFDCAIVIHSIHSMLKNSIHSIQKLMNGPTGRGSKPNFGSIRRFRTMTGLEIENWIEKRGWTVRKFRSTRPRTESNFRFGLTSCRSQNLPTEVRSLLCQVFDSFSPVTSSSSHHASHLRGFIRSLTRSNWSFHSTRLTMIFFTSAGDFRQVQYCRVPKNGG